MRLINELTPIGLGTPGRPISFLKGLQLEYPGGFFTLLTFLVGVDSDRLLGFKLLCFLEALGFVNRESGLYLGSAGTFVKWWTPSLSTYL